MSIARFGPFEVDRESGELRREGRPVRLREQPIRVLLTLLDTHGALVTREELRHRLWPDGVFVDFDRAINKAVFELRRALGDRHGKRGLIQTVSKRGYRIVADVSDLSGPERTGARGGLHSDADVAYVTGRYLCNRRRVSDLFASIACFERTIALGGDAGRAHAGLAYAHALLGIWGVRSPDEAFSAARRAATQALRTDPCFAESYSAFAEVLKGYEWSWPQSELHYQRALRIDPACAAAHHGYAQLLVSLGRHAEAIRHIELARRADPVSAAITSYAPYIYLAARQYSRAVREATKAVELETYSPLAHWVLGRAYLFSGCREAAIATLQRATELAGHASMWVSALCYARGMAGDRSGANELADALHERSRHEYVSPYDLAIACVGIGDTRQALLHLEQTFAQRVMRVSSIGDPEFDGLRAQRRSLLRRLNLPDTHA